MITINIQRKLRSNRSIVFASKAKLKNMFDCQPATSHSAKIFT